MRSGSIHDSNGQQVERMLAARLENRKEKNISTRTKCERKEQQVPNLEHEERRKSPMDQYNAPWWVGAMYLT